MDSFTKALREEIRNIVREEMGMSRRNNRQERRAVSVPSGDRPPSIQSTLRTVFKKVGTEVPRNVLMEQFKDRGQKESSVVTMMYDLKKMSNPIDIRYDKEKDVYRRTH